jgi:hypothetical protein
MPLAFGGAMRDHEARLPADAGGSDCTESPLPF